MCLQWSESRVRGAAFGDSHLLLKLRVRLPVGNRIGGEGLKEVTDALRGAKYSQKVPDETPIKLLRRGKLSCGAAGECRLLLELPEDVRSVD